ncbi:PKD domain-containing protein [Brumimicrobium mesophilum]|uniref:PKD domain-containing protein n=1 Tax=Brumimicrobium mesophilum TaxID=392717 RepID=UPI000D143418|nr:PKD domain-containing protein [Brumimicrobium mesophilum]
MKDNLEKAFKSSLEEYEVAYDPKAWDAVNSQLNANAAAGGSAISSAFKWVLSTVLVGAVITGSFFLWNDENKPKITETAVVQNEDQLESPITVVQEEQNKEEGVSTDNLEGVVEDLIVTKKEVLPVVNEQIKVEPKKEKVSINEKNAPKVEPKKEEQPTPPIVPVEKLTKKTQYVAGHISNAIVCYGETVEITNSFKNDKVRFQWNGEWIELNGGNSFELTVKESISINFVNKEGELIETKYIKVHEAFSPDFNLEANIFEGGLPVVIAESYEDFANYSWDFDGDIQREGAIVKHNFFDKGEYQISLQVTDANGCSSETSKIVRIRDKYNLMAVDAFKPNGSDVRNRAFMPYSLTERDVRFQLTIVDPIDNGVVFTSTDADEAWDGKDQRTGKMTSSNKSFIWKVQIFNPEMNERPIYAGTILHN